MIDQSKYSWHEVHQKVELVSGLERVVEFNDERMVHGFQNVPLRECVYFLLFSGDALFWDYFHGVEGVFDFK